MKVAGRPMRTIWLAADGQTVEIIDQTRLPHELAIVRLGHVQDAARAIRDMQVRGAPLIGATAAYGVALAMIDDPSDKGLDGAVATLAATRPTAVVGASAAAPALMQTTETKARRNRATRCGSAWPGDDHDSLERGTAGSRAV